jgi:hypothetical protein
LPKGLPPPLALRPVTIALVFYSRIRKEKSMAMPTSSLIHGYPPEETINRPRFLGKERKIRKNRSGRKKWKKEENIKVGI